MKCNKKEIKKGMNDIQKRNSLNIKLGHYNLILFLIIFLQIIPISISYPDTQIYIKIRGADNQTILNLNKECYNRQRFNVTPSRIIINNNNETNINDDMKYNLPNETNNITLIFNKSFSNINCMFKDLDNILEINFKNIYSNSLTEMISTFDGCTSLTSLDLSNLNTSKVTRMDSMFHGCDNLTSLNLDNFHTSKVDNMDFMFSNCSSLKTLDLSSFDTSSVSNMSNIFEGCKSLFLLNIKNFNLSNRSQLVNNFFIGCDSLKYLYISDDQKNKQEIKNHHDKVNKTLTICINNNGEKNAFNKSIAIINCSDSCFSESPKIINEKQICVLNCSEDIEYKYEYNNVCYNISPSGTIDETSNIINQDTAQDTGVFQTSNMTEDNYTYTFTTIIYKKYELEDVSYEEDKSELISTNIESLEGNNNITSSIHNNYEIKSNTINEEKSQNAINTIVLII